MTDYSFEVQHCRGKRKKKIKAAEWRDSFHAGVKQRVIFLKTLTGILS